MTEDLSKNKVPQPIPVPNNTFTVTGSDPWAFQADSAIKAQALSIRASHDWMARMAGQLAATRHLPTAEPVQEHHTLAVKQEEQALNDSHVVCCGPKFFEVAGKRVEWKKTRGKQEYTFTVTMPEAEQV